MAASDTLQFLGSGMTVRFFSLFFWQRLGMHPIATNAVYAGGPVGIAVCAILMQKVSRRAGRVLTTVICRSCSVLLLLAMALIMIFAPQGPTLSPCPPPSAPPVSPEQNLAAEGAVARLARVLYSGSLEALVSNAAAANDGLCAGGLPVLPPDDIRWLVVPLYLLRTWLMNCTSGLTKSVLNDYVAKRNRAKWNALESVNLFSWSGSSMLGGWLIKQVGFNVTFLLTAALQACSIVCLLPLLSIVRAEHSSSHGTRRHGERGSSLYLDTNGREQLLPSSTSVQVDPRPMGQHVADAT